ncbi:MAG: hypothetical protein ABI743_03825, partial [bacterium]
RAHFVDLNLPFSEPIWEARAAWDDDLEPGVVELPIFNNEAETGGPYSLEAELVAIAAIPSTITETHGSSAHFGVQNALERPYRATGTAQLTGTIETRSITIGGDSGMHWSESIHLPKGSGGVRMKVLFDREDFLYFTDCPIGIYNGKTALDKGGLGTREGETIYRGSDSDVELRIDPAFIEGWDPAEVHATIEIETLFGSPINGTVAVIDGGTVFPLAPGVTVDLDANFDSDIPSAPSGQKIAGTVVLTEDGSGKSLIRIPIRL